MFVTALRELGPRALAWYAWYQVGLRTGYLRWQTRGQQPAIPGRPLFSPPERGVLLGLLGDEGFSQLLAEADEIVAGRVRLFGGQPVPLQFSFSGPLMHWTAYARGGHLAGSEDIKVIWEAGRFGWACTLARAYHLSGDPRYAEAFWAHTEVFMESNPPQQGPQWESAQEVAIRLLAWVFSLTLISGAPGSTPERLSRLGGLMASHAARIPPTLAYARAQNNNHLLTEAVGLYTASRVMPEHASARRWEALGWQLANGALRRQIAPDGTYVQHSTNYHRLMLQAALWLFRVAGVQRVELPKDVRARLAVATEWLAALRVPNSGRVPNLGPNDGAYILPLTVCGIEDYRPVLQAAGIAFLGRRLLPPGPWDEMSLWFGLDPADVASSSAHPNHPMTNGSAPSGRVLRNQKADSWGYLRAARFTGRPGHADQLHLDLWWRGLNVAQDAGTYSYNAPPPWDHGLSRTGIHNTLIVDERDQMTRAGRFLWLNWAQAEVLDQSEAADGSWMRLEAQHDGYHRMGIIHRRQVTTFGDGRWVVVDHLLPGPAGGPTGEPQARLHWLLPDWDWALEASDSGGRPTKLRLRSPYGWIELRVEVQGVSRSQRVQLARAGQRLRGRDPVPVTRGWVCPTYGVKEPALSFSVWGRGPLPWNFTTEWRFP